MRTFSCTPLLGLCLIVGCAGAQRHTGSYNQFDSSTADALNDTQNVLEGLSAHISDYPKAVPAINKARNAYTTAKNDYLLWRCSVGVTKTLGPDGGPCPGSPVVTQAQVSQDLQNSNTAVAAAKDATTGGKP